MTRAGLMILKWLLIPIALAAAGYYFIGPRIGKLTEAPAISDAPPDAARQASTAPTNGSTDPASYPAPDVTVSSGATHEGAHPVTRHHHSKPKPKPSVTDGQPVVPPPDQGGSGGAATTTGGGDTGGNGDTGGTDG